MRYLPLVPLPFVAVMTCIALALRRTRWSGTALRASRWTYAIVFPTGIHHCRMRDLIPDMAGACAGAMAVLVVRRP